MRHAPLFLLLAAGSALAQEPRDPPTLVDFSEWEKTLPNAKIPSETLAASITEALTKQCGDRGAPGAPESYAGRFTSQIRQQIHFASCGTHPFRAPRVFAIVHGGAVQSTGDSAGGTLVHLVEDLDGDSLDEMVLSKKAVVSSTTMVTSRIVSYKSGAEEQVQDLGEVYTSNDGSVGTCQQRAAVFSLKVQDLSKVTKAEFVQPCGATGQWTPL